MAQKISDEINETKKCALIRLHGATERLLLLLQYHNYRNYEAGVEAVERAIDEYREAI